MTNYGICAKASIYGGERGIRTPGTPLRAYTRFPVVLLQPLGHLSIFLLRALRPYYTMAERVGFEPT